MRLIKFQSITPVKNLEDEYAGNVFSDIPNPMGKLYRNKDNQDKKSRLVGNLYAEFAFVRMGLCLRPLLVLITIICIDVLSVQNMMS